MTRTLLTEALPASSDWLSADVRTYLKDQAVHALADVTELRNSDMEMVSAVLLRSTGDLYTLNLASSAADDGEDVIHDALSRRYEKLASGAVAAAEAAQAAAEAAAENAQAAAYTTATWTALAAITGTLAGQGAEVLDADTGTHTDPVVGGTVANAGRFTWSASPAGWKWIGETGLSAKAEKVRFDASPLGPVTPITGSGTALGNLSVRYDRRHKSTRDQWIYGVEIGAAAAGTAILVLALESGANFTDGYGAAQIAFAAGANEILFERAILLPAGWVPGLKPMTANKMVYTTGTIPDSGTQAYTTEIPASSTAYTEGGSNGVQIAFLVRGDEGGRIADGFTMAEGVGAAETIGWPDVANSGSSASTYTTAIGPFSKAGRLYLNAGTAGGAYTVTTMSLSGSVGSAPTVTVHSSASLTLAAGVSADIDTGLDIEAGHYASLTGTLKYQSGANPLGITSFYKTGAAPVTGNTMTVAVSHRFEMSFTVRDGHEDRLTRLEAAGDPLAEADATGAADATAIFTAATAAHGHVHVRDGTFSLTAAPARDAGLYGAGKVMVGAIPYVIPAAPSVVSLMTGVQNVLAEHAAAGDVVALIGDSISHWAYATTGAKHWLNGLCAFSNYGVAADEPIMTALRPSSTYTPDFYGVTGTGGTTGTNGPIGESLILAAGESRAFTGTYETLGLFYEQASGAGTITVKRGATTLATINAAGTAESDKYSGDIATGVTSSASYTIEVTGAAAEITALVRLGVKTAGRNRIRFGRFAHGSYAFASFGAAQRASIIKICSAWGGKAVPVIALGTNDQFTVAPATIVANATALIADFVSDGAPRIFAIPPSRPSSAWAGSYTGGRTYDGMIGPLRRYYRGAGITVLPVDMIDDGDQGGLSDGLHKNDEGQWGFMRAFAEALARVG